MTPVIICGADLNQPDFDYTMQELANLAEACDMEVKDTVIQKLERPVSASYVGRGKAEEIKTQGKIHDARILIVNDELTPMQIRNLGDLTDMKIIDRTALILEIFASRARSKKPSFRFRLPSCASACQDFTLTTTKSSLISRPVAAVVHSTVAAAVKPSSKKTGASSANASAS